MKTNWQVITGAPSSGKTTVISELGSHGFYTFPEIARVHINRELLKGRTIQDVRKDENSFQNKLFDLKLELEDSLDPKAKLFLDIGLQESIAYFKLHSLDTSRIEKLCHRNYDHVFLLDPLPLEQDYARIETELDVSKLYKLIKQTYEKFGYDVIKIPADTLENRTKLILSYL